MTSTIISLVFIVMGVILIKLRVPAAKKAADLYKKAGVEVPVDLYSKQFAFIGVLLMIAGFLGATGLLAYL